MASIGASAALLILQSGANIFDYLDTRTNGSDMLEEFDTDTFPECPDPVLRRLSGAEEVLFQKQSRRVCMSGVQAWFLHSAQVELRWN